jgi:hypothetical protein
MAKPFTPEQLEALEREVRARFLEYSTKPHAIIPPPIPPPLRVLRNPPMFPLWALWAGIAFEIGFLLGHFWR